MSIHGGDSALARMEADLPTTPCLSLGDGVVAGGDAEVPAFVKEEVVTQVEDSHNELFNGVACMSDESNIVSGRKTMLDDVTIVKLEPRNVLKEIHNVNDFYTTTDSSQEYALEEIHFSRHQKLSQLNFTHSNKHSTINTSSSPDDSDEDLVVPSIDESKPSLTTFDGNGIPAVEVQFNEHVDIWMQGRHENTGAPPPSHPSDQLPDCVPDLQTDTAMLQELFQIVHSIPESHAYLGLSENGIDIADQNHLMPQHSKFSLVYV